MKYILHISLVLLLISCKKEKHIILEADREAPLGWIHLKLYEDNSFEFISKSIRNDEVFAGSFKLIQDTIYFKYKDSIPTAGSKAVIKHNIVYYLNGKYPESINIKINKIKQK